MITGFLVLIIFYFAYRLNRDEGIIVDLKNRLEVLEKSGEQIAEKNNC